MGEGRTGQDGAVRVIVLSDTHAPRRWRACPPAVAEQLRGADLILHAGDVCTAGVLDELAAYAHVRAVRGNNDGPDVAAWGAPDTVELDLDGLRVAMIHDAGPAPGGPRGCAAGSPPRAWSCSVTPISRSTTPKTGSGSSTPARPPTAAASPRAPSASWTSEESQLVSARSSPSPASRRAVPSRRGERPAGRGDDPVGVLAQPGDLRPVHLQVKPGRGHQAGPARPGGPAPVQSGRWPTHRTAAGRLRFPGSRKPRSA